MNTITFCLLSVLALILVSPQTLRAQQSCSKVHFTQAQQAPLPFTMEQLEARFQERYGVLVNYSHLTPDKKLFIVETDDGVKIVHAESGLLLKQFYSKYDSLPAITGTLGMLRLEGIISRAVLITPDSRYLVVLRGNILTTIDLRTFEEVGFQMERNIGDDPSVPWARVEVELHISEVTMSQDGRHVETIGPVSRQRYFLPHLQKAEPGEASPPAFPTEFINNPGPQFDINPVLTHGPFREMYRLNPNVFPTKKSPDGRLEIAYGRAKSGPGYILQVKDLIKKETKALRFPGDPLGFHDVIISHDNRYAGMIRNNKVMVLDLKTSRSIFEYSVPDSQALRGVHFYAPGMKFEFSPDSSSLLLGKVLLHFNERQGINKYPLDPGVISILPAVGDRFSGDDLFVKGQQAPLKWKNLGRKFYSFDEAYKLRGYSSTARTTIYQDGLP
ncbi:MAG: hypothetical protein ACAH59_10810 [Pseudobdellovibrionaceae bacterium]